MNKLPIYVRIKDPKEIRDLLAFIHTKIEGARTTLNRIQELSDAESHFIAEWKANFGDTNRKIADMSNALAEPDSL